MSSPPIPLDEDSDHVTWDVIVVGGGFAGVVAARDLRDSGAKVLLIEARDRLGGRTYYRRLEWADAGVEFGGTHVDPDSQPLIAAEITRYDVPMQAGVLREPHQYRAMLGGRLTSNPFPIPLEEVPALERAMFAIIGAAQRITPGTPLDKQPLGDLDVSWAEFMEPLGLPAATRGCIDCWVSNLGGTDPERISALYMLNKVAEEGNSPWRMFFGLATRFAHGTVSLIDRMVSDCGLEVRRGVAVRAIDQTAEDGRVVVATSADARLHARAVIVATPLNVWRDIRFVPPLSTSKQEAADEGQASRSAKVFALVRGVPPRLFAMAYGGVLRLAYEYADLSEGCVLNVWSDVDKLDMTDAHDVERALRTVAPSAEVLAIDGHDWTSDEFSKGAALTFRPGQVMRFHSALSTPEGRIHFAGGDVATTAPGSIEGAISSGAAASAAVLSRLHTEGRSPVSQSR